MTDFNRLFRERIGFPIDTPITMGNLDNLLELTAASLPFENQCTLTGNLSELNEESLIEKIIHRNEGGLCYDLNGILYLFLKDNNLDVQLIRGAVYVPELNDYSPTGHTHVAILLTDRGERYLVDTGFGGNLPLRPVPLGSTEMKTPTGEFRVKNEQSEFGDYILEMKLKHKDTDWRIGYAFDSAHPVQDVRELNETKRIITEHPGSPFNKKPLVTKVTSTGSMVLTETNFTQWKNGRVTKQEIDSLKFKQLAKEHYNLDIK
ncbi:arylamine N-acetyltransferase family protein [Mesobacillus jeotgali]|uniref:arylamine N-acetyltransferase family protein n=1 Tax=Mesobacillus jeotgali TaxID=129985 RepID=UPI0009A61B90|nr:arylamine N-acetyltransferase [Mesobacillus jeotgali]